MIFYFLFSITYVFTYMTILTQFKYDNRKSYIFLLFVNIILWLVCYAIYTYKGMAYLDYVFPLVVTVPAFICFLIVSKQKGFKLLFSFLTVCNFAMLKSYCGLLSFNAFNNLGMRLVLESFCFVLMLILLIKVFRKPYFRILDTLDKGWGLLCAAPFLLTILIYTLLYMTSSDIYAVDYIFIVIVVFILMFVFYAVVYLNFKNISQFFQLKETREIMTIQNEMQKKEYIAISDKINTVQIYNHDMKHHINIINTFLDNNNIEETKKYLGNLNDKLNKIIIKKYCENYALNTFLSSYISKAEDEQIEVASKVNIPNNINIDNIELGLIFTNAIENAINACKKIKNTTDRKISIVCKEHFNQLHIQICNTFIEKVVFDGLLPVSNAVNHGFGTRSIVSIVEKYEGTYSFIIENNIFKTTVILKYK